ncbi:MAG: sarcosine oxidase subunit gamma [Gammaproteobacteria bacterium]|nr:sarcosine oxidase subunit gamma [Gammaproteobacteria bacterium]
MDSLNLAPTPALGGWQAHHPGITVRELSNHSLVSIAAPLNGRDTLQQTLSSKLSLELPITGQFSASSDHTLLGLQPDQWFLKIGQASVNPVAEIADSIGASAHLTDQSDSWVVIELEGIHARLVLERICPIDLHPDVFSIGSVTRTSMEHLGVIIYRTATDTFVLLSARSSAESFRHALEVSINNALPD